jgi:predicted negative regulator of RcsB-dependent stress response
MEIKEQLKQDEQLLVQVFKLEKFIKKYKKHLIITAIILIVYMIGKTTYDYVKTQELIKTNNAFDELIANPDDKKALEIVKENKKLYELYLLKEGKNLDKITTPELKEFAAYKLAMKKGDIDSLESYLLNPQYKILKDAVRIALIRAYLKKGNRKKALEISKEIDPNSKFADIAKYMLHYGIVK